MGVYKKNTQTLGKLFPDHGTTDLYLSRWILFTKKTEQHAICFEINIKQSVKMWCLLIIEWTVLAG